MASNYDGLDGELQNEHNNVASGPFGTYPVQKHLCSSTSTTVLTLKTMMLHRTNRNYEADMGVIIPLLTKFRQQNRICALWNIRQHPRSFGEYKYLCTARFKAIHQMSCLQRSSTAK